MSSSGLEVREAEEDLRRAAADGNEEVVTSMVNRGININSQNSVNGWTALHWACKRGHQKIVALLLKAGADATVMSAKGETCLSVTSDSQIRKILGLDTSQPVSTGVSELPIVPNYIRHPEFPYGQTSSLVTQGNQTSNNTEQKNAVTIHDSEVVLKVRIANSAEKDFIEVDLSRALLTYDSLISLMCSELDVSRTLVQKVRKLPDTIVRRDKDVQRLRDFQELELVLAGNYPPPASGFQNYKASVAPKHFDVFY